MRLAFVLRALSLFLSDKRLRLWPMHDVKAPYFLLVARISYASPAIDNILYVNFQFRVNRCQQCNILKFMMQLLLRLLYLLLMLTQVASLVHLILLSWMSIPKTMALCNSSCGLVAVQGSRASPLLSAGGRGPLLSLASTRWGPKYIFSSHTHNTGLLGILL